MRITLHKSQIKGKTSAPPSKSYSIRALFCAALADGKSTVFNPLIANDTLAAADALRSIGVDIVQENGAWTINGGSFRPPVHEIYCGESAATLRFMCAICALVPGRCELTSGPTLRRRPIISLIQALQQIGVDCYLETNHKIVINGGKKFKNAVRIPGDISSQFVSAILFLAPFSYKPFKLMLSTSPKSRSFIKMTLECLQHFGIKVKASPGLTEFLIEPQKYRPVNYVVEGDWSAASTLMALAAVGGEIEIDNLNPSSLQGDRAILDILRDYGAELKVNERTIFVKQKNLNAVTADLSDSIDLLPNAAALSALSIGTSEFKGISNARLKESDRIAAMKSGLERTGIYVIEGADDIKIKGGSPRDATIESHNDHRIAMAFSIIGCKCNNLTIEDAECVSKTFPDYWDVIQGMGVNIEKYE